MARKLSVEELELPRPRTLVDQAPVLTQPSDQPAHPGKPASFTASAFDPDGDPITYTLSGSPPAGAAIDPHTGQFSWTPTWGQLGAWTISVKATDPGGLFDTKNCTITVGNLPPQLTKPNDQTGHPNKPVTFPVSAIDQDGDPITYALSGSPPAGATIDPKSGQFNWTPTWGQLGTWTITVVATDPGGLSDTKSCTITVGNQAPQLTKPNDQTGHPTKPVTFPASAVDQDGDPITYTLSGTPPAGAGITPYGQFSWTPTWGQIGTWTVSVTATDPGGLSDTKSCTITVGNQAPTVNPINNQTVTHGTPLNLTATANDLDGDLVIFSLVNPPAGAGIDGSGHFSWTPSAAQVGSWTITVQGTDPGGLSGVRSFTVTVN